MMLTVYSKPRCPRCQFVKKMLVDNHVQYREINVLENKAALDMLQQKNLRSLPVITDGIEWINGVDVPGLKQLVVR